MSKLLAGLRVLDFSGESADLAGRVLSDLGADVILVESPEGSSSRRLAPFVGDEPGAETAYRHLYFNAGKRSARLDPMRPPDRDELRAWAARSDVVIESGAPGEMAELGLGYEQLRRDNPSLIYASVTPFGQDAAWAHWKANDLVSTAACGLLNICGEEDDPPTYGATYPAYTMAGLVTAAGILIALRGRDSTNGCPGVHLDVSRQIATAFTILQSSNPSAWTQAGLTPTRPAISQAIRCADGKYASVNVFGNRLEGFIALLDEAGVEHDLTVSDWKLVHPPGAVIWKILENPLQHLAMKLAERHPRDEFLEKLRASGSAGLPSLTFPEMAVSDHYRAVGQFFEIDGAPDGRRLSFPRSPVDCVRAEPVVARAPLLGEHTAEVREELANCTAAEASITAEMPLDPLAGVRVLDFCWVLAGPLGTRILADFGADVIRIESGRKRLDSLRGAPLHDGRVQLDLPEIFNDANTGKRSLMLDLTKERARELVRELAAHSDAIVDNYSAGALARMGFPYQELRRINPRLVVLHMPGIGGRGPWVQLRTMGNHLMAASGLNPLSGFPGRDPRGMGIAYPDFTCPFILATSLLAALRERDRTGEGREIQLSQLSAAVSLVGAEWMRFAHTGVQPPPLANRDPNYCPHGVYPTRGDDEWLALAVADDAEWHALAEQVGGRDLVEDERFASHADRKRNEDALDILIGPWTAARDRWELAEQLQKLGIAAAPVEKLPDLVERDPQLRTHYQRVSQPSDPSFEIAVNGNPIRFAGLRHVLRRAPMLGEHSETVLHEILGTTPEEFGQLVLDGVIA